MSTLPAVSKPVLAGERYAVLRWRELCSPEAPWWSRSSGMGIRMCLRELKDMAHAGQEGTVLERTLTRLRKQARKLLLDEGTLLPKRFEVVAEQVRRALSAVPDVPDQFLPGGRNYAAVVAALHFLEHDVDIIELIAEELEAQAAAAHDWVDLVKLDRLVMLLDDELAYCGHSAAWRHAVAQAAGSDVAAGRELAEAITDHVRRAQDRWPRQIRWLFPVDRIVSRDQEILTNRLLDPDIVDELLESWPDLPEDEEVSYEEGAFEMPLDGCRDLEAGLEMAEDWLEQQASLWRLQGGDVTVGDYALAYDQTEGVVKRLQRPRPLKLLPDNLHILSKVLVEPPAVKPDEAWSSNLPDAIVQLAQARASSRGAALADLWTVAEAVFAGSAAETRVGAAPVMAEIAKVRYPEELLGWLSDRFDEIGLSCGQRRPGTKAPDWALDVFESHAKELFDVLESDPQHAVLYVRSKAIVAWSRSTRMEEDLEELGRRVEQVAERAYLVRNFFVHSAQPYRATALRVTLPVFAELVRICLGFLMIDPKRIDDPIRSAKLAVMRLARVADDYARTKSGSPEPLRDYLSS